MLKKKSALTEEEDQIVKTHTELGANLMSDLYASSDYNDFISTSIDVVHYHHENWDGTGYPSGLKGDDIPLAAQIVSVVDRYCTLTGDNAHTREEAIELMREEAGTKLNADIVEICCKISRQLS